MTTLLLGFRKFNVVSLLFVFVSFLYFPSAFARLPEISKLVEDVKPAVVGITALRTEEGQTAQQLPPMPDIFRHFFEHRMPPGQGGSRKPSPLSQGSGFIISSDGFVLTNHHVINSGNEVLVRLSDRSELKAEVIGMDPRSDLALLKVESDRPLPFVKMGEMSDVKVGQWVVAIGAPFGFEHSVTAGIVSAKRRSLPKDNYVPFIQTDVAINPGNSGGPLFNLKGEVIGINSQIYTRSGGFMGLSFAIPSDIAMNVTSQLKENGKVERGWLGVQIQEVTRELAESFDLPKPAGAIVADIVPSSPAEESGLKSGDVIIKYNDVEILRSSDLPHRVGIERPGVEGKLTIVRDGDIKTLKVTLGRLPEEGEVLAENGKPLGFSNKELGVVVGALSADDKERNGVEEGVVVKDVTGPIAARLGLRKGDVLTRLNNYLIRGVDDFKEATKEIQSGRTIAVRLVRQGHASFRTLKIR